MTKAKSATSSTTPKVAYSESETRLIELLRKARQPLSTTELVHRHWNNGVSGPAPFNARVIIGGILRTVQRKAVYNNEPWRLEHSGRQGPHAVEWQIVRG